MDRRIEFALKTTDPTLGIQLYEKILKKMEKTSPEIPEEIRQFFKDNIPRLGPLYVDNLYIYHKFNSMVDAINTAGLGKIRTLEPVEIEKYAETYKIMGTLEGILKDIDKEKMNETHLSECPVHLILYQVLWHIFIVSLYGQDFGTVLSRAVIKIGKSLPVLNEDDCPFSVN